jgi:hypothetical protein
MLNRRGKRREEEEAEHHNERQGHHKNGRRGNGHHVGTEYDMADIMIALAGYTVCIANDRLGIVCPIHSAKNHTCHFDFRGFASFL